ncbi:PREDICTED: uncharacterized protein LOC109582511 [Amphimedon queenslandica]|uniref:HECT domain-containing protein n=1 Tax=Amphimedon queenslandica TaxID=400682 RepID=A0AAN0J717_AMPQE|nr:PREDICTED: uncharacterized protein LOC109582511 [Amphimedon queenslandica]|eukprot:XP_019852814.1 PREDICTED: uncharacterized protein LOC109582511 [Amphimedon queenslandica]
MELQNFVVGNFTTEQETAKFAKIFYHQNKPDDRTPLFNAVKSGSIEAVNILFANGARTDVVSKDGKTLLHCAGESGNVEMIEFWIKRGDYDVNVQDNDNITPLFHAVESGSIEAVNILLNNGARTDVVSEANLLDDSRTPLHCASESGNAKIIELLITKGNADVNVVDENDRTPLFNAVKKGSIEADDGSTPLHCACKSGNSKVIELLITKGNADVNAVDEHGRAPLFKAVKSGSVEAVDILLTNGARTDVMGHGSTPLHCASEIGNAKLIKLLVSKGKADVNAVDKSLKRTPLFNAVKSGSIEAVDILLSNGARTDVVDENGETLLHCASESGKVEMLEFWIKREDFDVNALDERNRTPLFNAVEKHYKRSISIEAVDILLTNGARTDVVDKYDDSTPLHCASETGNSKIINLLITKGKADVNAVDEYNKTPLFNAVESGSIEAVDILLTNGARTDIVDKSHSPLNNLETLMKEFEGKVTREQAAAIYKSSGFSFDASMKCLKEGPTLESILLMLNQKMGSVESVAITVHTNDMWHDVLHHYKSGTVNFGKRLFVKLSDAPAIDAGGVRRQVYSTVYNEFQCNKHIKLFTGPLHSLSPACTAEARSSGLFKILGSMVGHSIWQDGIGFPFFSLTNYTYMMEGEEKALQVCSDNDIGAGVAEVISKVYD